LSDREEIRKLVAEYHFSEHLTPNNERMGWTLGVILTSQFPGIVILAREYDTIVGVALAVYLPSAELGRVLSLHDFYVAPIYRRKGIGRELVNRILEEAKRERADEVNLEVIQGNETAVAFWKSIGLEEAGRLLLKRRIEYL
jgi:GNAT superfamily N-acetyltransferase